MGTNPSEREKDKVVCRSDFSNPLTQPRQNIKDDRNGDAERKSPRDVIRGASFTLTKTTHRKIDSVHTEMFMDCCSSSFAKPTRARSLFTDFIPYLIDSIAEIKLPA